MYEILKEKSKLKKKGKNETAFIILMLALPVVHFLIFWLYINFDSILLAFQAPSESGVKWSLENFEYVFNDFFRGGGEMLMALRNTFLYFSFSILVFPLALLMTYFIYKRVRGYKVFRIIFYFPTIISAAATASMFKYIIAGNGPLAILLSQYGKDIPFFLSDSRYAIWTLLFYVHFFGLGGNLVLLGGTMATIDTSVLEAAKMDGVTQMQELVKVIIPMMWPTISTILILASTGVFTATGPILLFTKGSYNTTSLSYWIFNKVQFEQSLNQPAAVGMIFMLLTIPIVFGANIIQIHMRRWTILQN